MYHPLSPNLDLGSFLLVRGKKTYIEENLLLRVKPIDIDGTEYWVPIGINWNSGQSTKRRRMEFAQVRFARKGQPYYSKAYYADFDNEDDDLEARSEAIIEAAWSIAELVEQNEYETADDARKTKTFTAKSVYEGLHPNIQLKVSMVNGTPYINSHFERHESKRCYRSHNFSRSLYSLNFDDLALFLSDLNAIGKEIDAFLQTKDADIKKFKPSKKLVTVPLSKFAMRNIADQLVQKSMDGCRKEFDKTWFEFKRKPKQIQMIEAEDKSSFTVKKEHTKIGTVIKLDKFKACTHPTHVLRKVALMKANYNWANFKTERKEESAKGKYFKIAHPSSGIVGVVVKKTDNETIFKGIIGQTPRNSYKFKTFSTNSMTEKQAFIAAKQAFIEVIENESWSDYKLTKEFNLYQAS
ncbi:hypothetical protein VF_A0415 [Aliivibrio fischeri ES114]|uniref:Uncharacterized protein n=1 Tax=Aliivibrio fischeri (strain ATCC 700601 / ES114) TaxID=312309 RepID=Q5E0G1_ALIF1|nr:hypothetical protein [Aliivibrio fischeri]AAW87485.1 hypothetical protein VF_A0415 [Aliivibrio fischeri ES114]KLU77203.1 hypothetical protein AB192_19050 [Aliivibrio fischeri]MCE7577039.1 hypothetical protein [Aliivibrio fischeri]MCE7589328.1 hypothetical protein [Aliivibrio fischeri]MUJ20313.1 hypothetical protein [Aliivibrio fischeri]